MTILVISASTELRTIVQEAIPKQSVLQIIHYRNPVKAMDNVEEIKPSLILFSYSDYPRHWKPFLSYIRASLSREEAPFVLLSNIEISALETEKIIELEVNSVLLGDIGSERLQSQLKDALLRFPMVMERSNSTHWIPQKKDDLSVCLAHPFNLHMITGRLIEVFETGLFFVPDYNTSTKDISDGVTVDFGTLKKKDKVISFKGILKKIGNTIAIDFDTPIQMLQKPDATSFK